MDLAPTHRIPLRLPRPWPACAQSLLREGASWLHTGQLRAGDEGGDLLCLPEGPRLECRWIDQGWSTTLDGQRVEGSPFEILTHKTKEQPFPWLGAISFELACWEAGLPHQTPLEGFLGMHWRGAPQALWVSDDRAELWSWGSSPAMVAPVLARLALACALGRLHGSLAPAWNEARHREAVEAIRHAIHEGDFYVANLCVPFEGSFGGDPVTLALSAFRKARPPYGAYMPMGEETLLALTMERLLARRGDDLWTEPIKGSAPLRGNLALDIKAAEAMRTDPKEQAEHTMIVDLLRNDLGRVARTGSVRVTRLMEVERFPTVQHLVSRVEATAKPGLELPELLRAVLPGGSVTGAPKHAVCGHLARTEAGPRGFYCGALGWIAPNGDLDLALPIRTARLSPGHITYWAGGGITRKSDPEKEWQELHLKTRVITESLR